MEENRPSNSADIAQVLLVTVVEAAKMLSVSRRTIYRLIDKGVLSVVMITPDAPRLRVRDLIDLIQKYAREEVHNLRPCDAGTLLA